MKDSLETWERAEIERSSVEARLTSDSALRMAPLQMARYGAPPATTAYPLEYAYHLLGDVRGLRVIDFGCGSGADTLLLTNRGAHVWAVDISEDLIRVGQRRLAANNRGGQAQFIVGSAHDLPFPPNSIDIVFGIAILHHLDLELASKEVCRVLRPGGRAIFQEPVRNSATMRFVRRLIPYRSPDISPYERPLTDRELRSFAKGLSVTRSRAFCLPHVLVGERLPFIRKHYGALYRTDAALLRKVPGLGYYAGIRVLEVTKARR